MTKCEFCPNPVPAGSRSHARFCSARCKQAAYRSRAAARAAAQHWQPGDKAIAQGGFIVEIGKATQEYAIVRVQYTVKRAAADKASVWRKLPLSKLRPLEAIPTY